MSGRPIWIDGTHYYTGVEAARALGVSGSVIVRAATRPNGKVRGKSVSYAAPRKGERRGPKGPHRRPSRRERFLVISLMAKCPIRKEAAMLMANDEWRHMGAHWRKKTVPTPRC